MCLSTKEISRDITISPMGSSTAQHSTARHSTAQHSAAQHDIARPTVNMMPPHGSFRRCATGRTDGDKAIPTAVDETSPLTRRGQNDTGGVRCHATAHHDSSQNVSARVTENLRFFSEPSFQQRTQLTTVTKAAHLGQVICMTYSDFMFYICHAGLMYSRS